MPEIKTLHDYAVDILQRTCPYKGNVKDMSYSTRDEAYTYSDYYGRVDICEILKVNLGNKKLSNDARYAEKYNNRNVYDAIELALTEYVRCYPACHSYKVQMKETFRKWIIDIRLICGITNRPLPEEVIPIRADVDTAVAMVKALHVREGVSRQELKEMIGISDRAVHTNLRKLDKNLCEWDTTKDKKEYVPFRIGGQPVNVKITEKTKGHKKTFCTVDSLHPIVLQENMTQTATILQALARNYESTGTSVNLSIAIDIWYQLTDYAKEKIKQVYHDDEALVKMIDLLENDFPDSHLIGFMTEQEMIQEYNEMSPEDARRFREKVPGRRVDITIV